MLSEAGLKPGQDVTIKNMQNHAVAVNYLIAGEVAAAIVSDRCHSANACFNQGQNKNCIHLGQSSCTGHSLSGQPDLPHDKLKQIKQTIHEFAQHSEEGIKLMNDMGYGPGLIPAGTEDMRPLQPYGALLKKAITGDP